MENSADHTQIEGLDLSLSHTEQLAITKYQITKWNELTIFLFGCFVFVLLHDLINTPLILAVLPSLLLDVRIASQCAFRLRQDTA